MLELWNLLNPDRTRSLAEPQDSDATRDPTYTRWR